MLGAFSYWSVPFYTIQFENHLNKVKLVQIWLNSFLALKLVRYELIIHLLCDPIKFAYDKWYIINIVLCIF